jgi:hypothetical protein
MPYALTDFENIQRRFLGDEGSLWRSLKKDLLQLIEMPSHFDQATQRELGTGLNLSLMTVAVGGLEAMATLANVDGLPLGVNATDTVQRFAERYFSQVNALCARPRGESLLVLLWDAWNSDTHELVGRSNQPAHPLSEPRGGLTPTESRRPSYVRDHLT